MAGGPGSITDLDLLTFNDVSYRCRRTTAIVLQRLQPY